MVSTTHRLAVCLSGLAAIVFFGGAAHAQQSPPPAAAPASAAVLSEVTITAQKRKEDARKVPLSVSVLSGEAIRTPTSPISPT